MAGERPAGGPALPVAPVAMAVFWMLLGGAAGINIAQAVWHLLGWAGDVAAAVPVGGVIGAIAGALLGLVRDPSRLVLLMAVFAGASAGAVAGRLAAGAVGEFAGQAAGVALGAAAWTAWRGNERRKARAESSRKADSPATRRGVRGQEASETDRCQQCDSARLARVLAHCSDMCSVDLTGRHRHGYVPRDLGIGGGDDVQFAYCLDCGQIQGRFPLPASRVEDDGQD